MTSTDATATGAASTTGPTLHVLGHDVPLVGPSRGDPRLRLSVVIVALHVLGQTMLGFKVSIAQVAITVVLCGAIDAALTLRRERRLVWPASGILTGTGLAFILRASGTEHGDWWSLNGIEYFVLGSVLALASKHLVRPRGRHLFNPSNVALVWVFLVIGPTRVFPQPLWWGDDQVGVALAYGVLFVGAWWILRRVHMTALAASFVLTFAVLVAIIAASGASFVASWHADPIEGFFYWQTVALSPELLLFAFFMITDPQTTPRDPTGRIAFGITVATVTAALMWFQPTEFGVKLALLSSLVVACALVPVMDRAASWLRARIGQPGGTTAVSGVHPSPGGAVATLRPNPALVAALVITLAAPLNTAVLAGNDRLVDIERGLTAPGTGQ